MDFYQQGKSDAYHKFGAVEEEESTLGSAGKLLAGGALGAGVIGGAGALGRHLLEIRRRNSTPSRIGRGLGTLGLGVAGYAAQQYGNRIPGHVGDLIADKLGPSPIPSEDIAARMGVPGIEINRGSPAFRAFSKPFAPVEEIHKHIQSHGVIEGINRGVPSTPAVDLPRNSAEAIAAHEFGHAINSKGRSTVGRIPSALMGGISSFSGPAAAVYSAASKRPSWFPALAHLGLSVPTLAEEARASLHAGKYLVGQHGWREGLRRASPLVPYLGSYAVRALTPAAIVAARRFKR